MWNPDRGEPGTDHHQYHGPCFQHTNRGAVPHEEFCDDWHHRSRLHEVLKRTWHGIKRVGRVLAPVEPILVLVTTVVVIATSC